MYKTLVNTFVMIFITHPLVLPWRERAGFASYLILVWLWKASFAIVYWPVLTTIEIVTCVYLIITLVIEYWILEDELHRRFTPQEKYARMRAYYRRNESLYVLLNDLAEAEQALATQAKEKALATEQAHEQRRLAAADADRARLFKRRRDRAIQRLHDLHSAAGREGWLECVPSHIREWIETPTVIGIEEFQGMVETLTQLRRCHEQIEPVKTRMLEAGLTHDLHRALVDGRFDDVDALLAELRLRCSLLAELQALQPEQEVSLAMSSTEMHALSARLRLEHERRALVDRYAQRLASLRSDERDAAEQTLTHVQKALTADDRAWRKACHAMDRHLQPN